MHLIVPFAAPASEAGRAALGGLVLPHLAKLLSRLQPVADTPAEAADELSLTPPHERALACALGLPDAPDGQVPLAAWLAMRAGLATSDEASGWGLLTPAHWRLGTEQVSLLDPALLNLDEASSRAFLAAVAELFTSEGFALHLLSPVAWLCRHPMLDGLPTASLDRVVGRNVDRWLQADPRARLVRRLQNEVQMLLHAHPLNDTREAEGELPLNSVWLSGTGPAPTGPWTPDIVMDDALRSAALNEDPVRWAAAWRTLDADVLAPLAARDDLGGLQALTLCGERASRTWRRAADGGGLLRRLGAKLGLGRVPAEGRVLASQWEAL